MRFYEIPEVDRERLPFGAPYRAEVLDLGAGPRSIPSWAWDARIDWRWGYSNRPDFLLRCRHNPLSFTSGPVWRMLTYDDAQYDAGARRIGRQDKGRAWIAESEGIASCHYHSGIIRMVEFDDAITDEKGNVVWAEKPDYKAGKAGVAEGRQYSMLATDKEQGYAGSAFDITLSAQQIPIWDEATRREVMTDVAEGTKLRLRGPWHGGAPEGYLEVSYQYDSEQYLPPKRSSWHRKWHQRLGFFGLCIKPDVLLDIITTFLPHVEWARPTGGYKDGDRTWIEPLIPETGLPKGWVIDPANCRHDFMISNYSKHQQPFDDCRWCDAKRDPTWFPAGLDGRPVEWWAKRKPSVYVPRYFEQRASSGKVA